MKPTETAFKIEKGIPIPNGRNGVVSGIMRKISVGDSVLIPKEKRATWLSTARFVGIRVASRKEADEMRIWRIADESKS